MNSLTFQTSRREEMLDITRQVRDFVHVRASARQPGQAEDGALLLFCPHTTCGLTINESADPDVRRDLTSFFSRLAPAEGWLHAEGNSDAHIKCSLLGSSLLIPLEKGDIRLGVWQAIYLYEGDGPRSRSVRVQWLSAAEG